MGTSVFSFLKIAPWNYGTFHETETMPGNFGGAVTRPRFGPYGLYSASFVVRVPGNSLTITDWAEFLKTVRGGYDSFLLKDPLLPAWYRSTAEALGTGSGSQTDFALDFKHVDAATLTVYKDGVLQSSGWSLVTNNTAPKVRFSVAPSVGVVVTATYEFYIPVRFAEDPPGGEFLAVTNFNARVSVVEDYSGAHRV